MPFPIDHSIIYGFPIIPMHSTRNGDNITVWPVDSYDVPRALHHDEEQQNWLVEQGQACCSRDGRIDGRPLPSSHHQPQHQPQGYSPNFMQSPDLLQSQQPAYHSGYSRNGQPPLSSWNFDLGMATNALMNQTPRYEKAHWNAPMNHPVHPMEPQVFDSPIFSSPNSSSPPALYTPPPQHINGFEFPLRISPSPTPSPILDQEDVKPIISTHMNAHGRRRSSDNNSESGKSCSHCHATTTPLWRRDPSTMKPLCNACGLYLQQRNKLRPQELIDADDDGSTSDESDVNYVGPECSHCRTHRTSVWRRSKTGEQLCNACGVYLRLRGKPRPLSLKKNKIRPRSKHSPK
ncbi:hypothetical protein CPB83DRAFT_235940 [Crepidotus variabilis]|uniref:GATA-type domain-containing protein n=1 Tax=Crepidotus variabilis TaxID=179855 RepID=A0A9P6ESA9_9AGAR|nr:hypothetical protein CPB83DRAFT_235940 [Crepidotus variabilis]